MKKPIKNTTSETYCVRHCCQDTPKRAINAEGGAVSINKLFNDWGGRGYDDSIPGEVTKTDPSGDYMIPNMVDKLARIQLIPLGGWSHICPR